MKILWVIPKWTFPVSDGARVATDRLIKNTKLAGATIDVICFANFDEKVDISFMQSEWQVDNVTVIRRVLPKEKLKLAWYYLKKILRYPLMPLTVTSFMGKGLAEELANSLKGKQYDNILLDGLHIAAPLWKNGNVVCPKGIEKIIYRAHNVEADLWKTAAKNKKNFLFKLFLMYQYFLMKRFEDKVVKKSDAVCPISQEDFDFLENRTNSKMSLTPLGMNFKNQLDFIDKEKLEILYIGRLDWPPNKDGLEWFLKNVWPKLMEKRKDIQLNIAGSGNSSWLQAYANLEGVNLLGFVDDINDAYKNCDLTIAPIFYGSGTRIKVLESYAKGRAMITTKMSVQGSTLDEKSVYFADTEDEWIKTLLDLKMNDEVKRKAQYGNEHLAKSFDSLSVAKNFYSFLKTVS